MNKQCIVWQLILESLEQEIPVMLLYVLESRGSSPGRQGFFMAVNRQGKMEGSIGGGIMEHKFAEMAKDRLVQKASEPTVRKQVHDKEAAKDQSGMICSGEQTILLYPVRSGEIDAIRDILSCLDQNRNGLLRLSPAGLEFAGLEFTDDAPGPDFRFYRRSNEDWLYEERAGYKNHLYIVGGGHCALAFSRIMQWMDFYIHLFEHRPGLHTLTRNEFVHEKVLVTDYSALNEQIPSGAGNHYVVVMTLSYRTDDQAVRALLGKPLRYFGVLGSKTKMEKLFAAYRAEGITEEHLQRIHSPAGISIKSQTPEEIAISIAAEIIREKNRDSF